MTAAAKDNLLKWGAGITASLILTLGGWVYNQGARIEVQNERITDNERQLQNLWGKLNQAQEKEALALQRLTRIETQIEDLKK